jgi:hypothetical protein
MQADLMQNETDCRAFEHGITKVKGVAYYYDALKFSLAQKAPVFKESVTPVKLHCDHEALEHCHRVGSRMCSSAER